MQPIISLILPVYNGEQTIAAALESVFQQSFSDFECLIVNDGSTDGTAALIAAAVAGDPRFQVFTIPNGGVSRAKNLALAKANGAYWTFLDADDRLAPDALKTLYGLLQERTADLAIGHLSFEDAQGRPTAMTPPLPPAQLPPMTGEQAAEIVFQGKPFAGHLVGKLLKAEPIKDLRFREDIAIYEDMLFLLEALRRLERAVYAPTVVYHYYVSQSGAFSRSFHPRKASSLLACEEMQALTRQAFPQSLPAANRFALQNALWVAEDLAASPAADRRQPWAKSACKKACEVIRTQPVPADMPAVQKCFCLALRLDWPWFQILYQGPYRLLRRILRP